MPRRRTAEPASKRRRWPFLLAAAVALTAGAVAALRWLPRHRR